MWGLWAGPLGGFEFWFPIALISLAIVGILIGLIVRSIRNKKRYAQYYADKAAKEAAGVVVSPLAALAAEKSYLTDGEADKKFINEHPKTAPREQAKFQVGGPAS